MQKICDRCGVSGVGKEVLDKMFYKRTKNPDGYDDVCKFCKRELLYEWRKNNPEKLREQKARRRKKLKELKLAQEKAREDNNEVPMP